MSERSEREIRESIETTRARMGETIEQIGDRVNPDRVKADLKARARDQIGEVRDNMKRKARNTMRDVEHGVTDTGRGIWATIRENPVPAGMVGVGVAWLLANRRNSDSQRHYEYDTYSTGPAVPYRAGYTGSGGYGSTASAGYDSTTGYGTTTGYGAAGSTPGYETGLTGGLNRGYQDRVDARTTGFAAGAGSAEWSQDSNGQSEGVRERASEAVHQAGERVGSVVHGARERAGEMVHETQERVGGAVHGTRDRVSSMAQSAKYRAQSAEHRVEESLRENPVAAGAVALAIGMAAGLMIPETDREHQMLGKARERVMDKAQDAVRRSADKLHDAARDAAGESARHAVDEVWPMGDEGESGESTGGFSEPRR